MRHGLCMRRGTTELRAGLWCWARSGLRGAAGWGGVVRVVRGRVPGWCGLSRGMGAGARLRRSRRMCVGDRPGGVHRWVVRTLGLFAGSHHSGRARRERHVEVDGFRPELSCFASGRYVDRCCVDFGGRRCIDDRFGADRLFALWGLRLLRIGAERLLILRVLGGLLTHSKYATGAAGSRTARRPPTPRRVFPTPCDRPHWISRWTLEPRTASAAPLRAACLSVPHPSRRITPLQRGGLPRRVRCADVPGGSVAPGT